MNPCRCGKTKFHGPRGKTKAEQVLLKSKILRELRGKEHRREQRIYRCPHNPNIWHLTSMPTPTDPTT